VFVPLAGEYRLSTRFILSARLWRWVGQPESIARCWRAVQRRPNVAKLVNPDAQSPQFSCCFKTASGLGSS
jgi:hypothetical protein